MSITDIVPDDFDWVTARINWSVAVAYDLLRELVQKNVETRGALATRGEDTRFGFQIHGADVFRVTDRFGSRSSKRRAVDFILDADRIVINDDKHADVTAWPFIDSRGQRKFRAAATGRTVPADDLQPWELARFALDELLFPD